MPNRAFRLLLCLSSVYIVCVTFFNVFVGSFSNLTNISLIATSLLSILQIINLIVMYKYDEKMLKIAFYSEGLLIISSIWTMIEFPYLLGQLIFGLIITLLTIGLVYVAQKEIKRTKN